MTEASFTRSVHDKLPPFVYAWKISDRFTSGIPDAYYSATNGDLWIEYKYVKKLPKKHVRPKLSELQKLWLDARLNEGRNVAVVVGSPQGHVIFVNGEWNSSKEPDTLFTTKQIAQWITNLITNTEGKH